MTESLRKGVSIYICVALGIMVIYICAMIVYYIISDIKDRKRRPKIEDLERQLEDERAKRRRISDSYDRLYEEYRALALAVNLCIHNNLNLNQLQELGLQRYNALQKRGNYITDLAYEELVKHHIIERGARS